MMKKQDDLCPHCHHNHPKFPCGVVIGLGDDRMGLDDEICGCKHIYGLRLGG